jgi:hypothetical protein
MENQQPEALRLADKYEIEGFLQDHRFAKDHWCRQAAAELRRLHARVQELEGMLDSVGAGGVSAQRITQGKDHFAQDRKMAPVTVVLPEPVAAQTRLVGGSTNWTTVSLFHAKSLTGGAYELRYLHTEQQVRELLARDLGGVNLDRLDKALIKLGYATWVSQEEAAANIPHWVNALTRCVLETPVAAPQPQADALDTERWRFIKRKLCLTGNGDGTCAMQALNLPARILGWPDVGELAIAQFLDAAIDAAIAAAKGE